MEDKRDRRSRSSNSSNLLLVHERDDSSRVSPNASLRMEASGGRLLRNGKGSKTLASACLRQRKMAVFLERPLSTPLQEYCAQDVLVMPKLLSVYGGRVPHHLAEQTNTETLARVVLSQSANFNGKGRHMAVGPSIIGLRYVFLPVLSCVPPCCTLTISQVAPFNRSRIPDDTHLLHGFG